MVGGTLAALALATSPANAGTASATGSPDEVGAQLACGYDTVGGSAYYTHCNSNVNVLIRVERHWGNPGFDYCVHPGANHLGFTWDIRDAWYKGVLC